ncbi:hypothetical protein [Streptomyces flavidovirens]|uniref:hypothetical protein n=1 Tax=Streptomyces flavidovirens TaxID=67298 RepID=UPI00368F717F
MPNTERLATPVTVLVVPSDTPGSRPVGEAGRTAVLVRSLKESASHPGEAEPEQILRPSEDERAAAPLALSRGADYVRVWDRASEEVVAALISDSAFIGADLSPDSVLVVVTECGAKALRIRPRAAETAS